MTFFKKETYSYNVKEQKYFHTKEYEMIENDKILLK